MAETTRTEKAAARSARRPAARRGGAQLGDARLVLGASLETIVRDALRYRWLAANARFESGRSLSLVVTLPETTDYWVSRKIRDNVRKCALGDAFAAEVEVPMLLDVVLEKVVR